MPKVYVTDFNELPTFEVYDTKPSGFPSDAIELTDAELARVRSVEVEFAAVQSMLRDKVGGYVFSQMSENPHLREQAGVVIA